MTYKIRPIPLVYAGGTQMARPRADMQSMQRVGASFEAALAAGTRIASERSSFQGFTSQSSAAVLQAADGAYYVARLTVESKEGPTSLPVDGSVRKSFFSKSFSDAVEQFSVTNGADGLRAIVGEHGYWKVDEDGASSGYVALRD